MKKQKIILISIISGISLGIVSLVVLLIFELLPLFAAGLLIGMFGVSLLVCIFLLWQLLKKMKEEKLKKASEEIEGNSMTDLYGLLGIPVQYNKDGTVKDIYELLGITPEFDENGKRLPTIYEQLGVAPQFDKDGNEIPTVFVIKNRVKRIAKVDTNSRIMIRKPTEQEKEEIVIRETLKQKLDEAERQGDTKKVENIKKVINDTNKKKEEPKKAPVATVPKYGMGKGGKTPGSVSLIGAYTFLKFFDLAAKRADKPAPPKTPVVDSNPENKPDGRDRRQVPAKDPERNVIPDKGNSPAPVNVSNLEGGLTPNKLSVRRPIKQPSHSQNLVGDFRAFGGRDLDEGEVEPEL